jgi:hypothetical protein
MAKWSIRDLWGRRTENKALKPEVRNMLTSLDGVYEPREPNAVRQTDEQRTNERAEAPPRQ